jgi:hypothetical protein
MYHSYCNNALKFLISLSTWGKSIVNIIICYQVKKLNISMQEQCQVYKRQDMLLIFSVRAVPNIFTKDVILGQIL